MPTQRGCGTGGHLFLALILGVTLCLTTHGLDYDNTPRWTTWIQDLRDYTQFRQTVSNSTTFWLEEQQKVLYVGARNAIFALNTNNINDQSMKMIRWEAIPAKTKDCLNKHGQGFENCHNYIRFLRRFNGTHLYACGTYAFLPHCAYVDIKRFTLSAPFEGKDSCPYDPTVGYTGVVADNKIYTATLYGFQGRQADIKKSFDGRLLKMDDSVLWKAPNFIDSMLLRESVQSSVGDDDKIYVFFTEKLGDENAFNGKPLVSLVARVCKNDEGGSRTLQKRWTSFLKTRIVCSIPEYDFHFNILKSIFVFNQKTWQNTIIYGVFGSQWQNVQISAVCQYTIADIRKAFEGPYKEVQESARWWARYTGAVPTPRPGSCITDAFKKAGVKTSRDLPDDVLEFVKKRTLMDEEVRPVGGRPLVTKKLVSYTKMVVDTVTALDDKQYRVMFIGTADGWIHKVVHVGARSYAIEEMQVYKEPQPVESLVLVGDQSQRTLIVGAQSGVIQVAVSSCHKYRSCLDCIMGRDPYCGWDGESCQEVQLQKDRTGLIQDIVNGNKGCLKSKAYVLIKTVPKDVDLFLSCPLSSNTAAVLWTFGGKDLPGGSEPRYQLDGKLLVVRQVQAGDAGRYHCHARENGLVYPVASYDVRVGLRLMSTIREIIYLFLIAALGVATVVLSVLCIYLCCSSARRGKSRIHLTAASGMELQNVAGLAAGKGEEEEAGRYSGERFLKIIPGEGAAVGNHLSSTSAMVDLLPPPPPPPPPLPLAPDPATAGATPNGLAGLPHVLRKMNGNSYVLLRQAGDVETISSHYHSFTEELSKMLEKRKHAQLVDKLDESSV
ncbi:semaphorin-4G [Amblyraja radiata]|uniref:semaphorin-4G n=1 Tax=Amblyraja radiata TaxID=386614 RepID=UPI001403189B|nr:semaphorin-4G [Amblyraja radiata]XP_032889918.1 semaphorin-4G [Amblyraja radiata]XP_032889920.1 semaphorin-4G [Amblyraja radiata]